MKKYHIKTWGCQMNVYDSGRIGEILQTVGYENTEDVTESDLVILNTCHIREKATEKVFSDIGRLKKIKDRRKEIGLNLIIGVAGCVAQAEGKEILARSKDVDFVLGSQMWNELPDIIKKIEEKGKRITKTDFPVISKYDSLPEMSLDKSRIQNSSAFLAVQEGCDKFCTYCVVPYTRGAEYSRPVTQLLLEAQLLAQNGAKEITLLGQNVNAYHGLDEKGNESTLAKLIERVAKIDGIQRIRYTTSYPAEVTEDLIEAHRDIQKLMPFLHLPMQSGSSRILKEMNRRHTVAEYIALTEKLYKARPDLKLSSDFIIGFPTETDSDFKDTMNIVKEIGFIQSYAFMYSKRAGTPAALMEDQVPHNIKEERLYQLQDVLLNNQVEFNKKCEGAKFSILLDRTGRKDKQMIGRSPYMQPVHLETELPLMGEVVSVHILKGLPHSLHGELA